MREIKFRAWGKFGSTKHDEMRYHWENDSLLEYIGFGGDGFFQIMQYTGLKDKNGKEICEGDIVESTLSGKKRGVVEFYPGRFSLKFSKKLCMTFMYENRNKLKVIGNIYEHPKLLKEAKWQKHQ